MKPRQLILLFVLGGLLVENAESQTEKQQNKENTMKRVIGIGGIFFKSKDPKNLKQWYAKHLGVTASDESGSTFEWRSVENPDQKGHTIWSPFKHDTKYFEPSTKEFMFNYRVENLVTLLEELRKEGVTVVGTMEEYEYGKFGWILDPDGNKIELWEPPAKGYDWPGAIQMK